MILRDAVREPLFHFVLLAAGLFAVAAVIGSRDDVIEVSREEIEWRILQIEANEGALLTEDQRRLVEEAYIDERVLIREAQGLGLVIDERIDDILVQKMLHVLSGDVIQPTEAELTAYYNTNVERYVTNPEVTVDEIVLPADDPLPQELRDGAAPEELAEGRLISHRIMTELAREDLGQLFGEGAATLVLAANPGVWVSASQSVPGRHWFRIRERFATTVQPFSVVRDVVRFDWIAEQEERRLLLRVAELRASYTVVVEAEREEP